MPQTELIPHPIYTLNPQSLSVIALDPIISLDLETTGVLCWKDTIRLIAVKTGGTKYLLQPAYYSKEQLVEFFKRVAERQVIGHGIKFDVGFIYCSYGVILEDVWCTQLGSQVIGGGSRKFRHDLAASLLRHLRVDIGTKQEKREKQRAFGNNDEITVELLDYAATDVEHLIELRAVLETELSRLGLDKIIKLENKLVPVLAEMEGDGCLIDVVAWRAKLKEWEQIKKTMVGQLDAEVLRICPYYLFVNINYGSSKQVIDFFKKMGLPPPIKEEQLGQGKKKRRESVDEDTLNNYINENQHSPIVPFIKLLLDYREYDKLLSTYGDSFLGRVDSNNHIHTTYKQCTAVTGRLSSSNPNLQNIPTKKSGAGAIVRTYFIAPPGFDFETSDMEGAEVVIAADLSKDPLLLKNLLEGADMHSHLASISFSIIFGRTLVIIKTMEPLEVDGHKLIPEDCREIHKSVTFSKFYKGGPARVYQVLARYINMVRPPKERMPISKDISVAIDSALYRLSHYLTTVIDKANLMGYLVTTKLGRRRYFDTKVFGEAANAPIQGSNADAMKIALINIRKYMKQIGGKLVLTVHDEACVIVPEAVSKEAAEVVKTEMSKALTFVMNDLEGKASVRIGKYWKK